MCDQAIGDDPPAVCPRCGWELVELDETPVRVAEIGTPAPRVIAAPSIGQYR
jgi:hypothetical protein